jgi:hypothetical protein
MSAAEGLANLVAQLPREALERLLIAAAGQSASVRAALQTEATKDVAPEAERGSRGSASSGGRDTTPAALPLEPAVLAAKFSSAAALEPGLEPRLELYTVALRREGAVHPFGFSLAVPEPEDGRIEVEDVDPSGQAFSCAVQVGDELVACGGLEVAALGAAGIERARARAAELQAARLAVGGKVIKR